MTMQLTRPITNDPVLQAALETREEAWQAVLHALEDDCHVTIIRACIAEWVAADDRVKARIKELRSELNRIPANIGSR